MFCQHALAQRVARFLLLYLPSNPKHVSYQGNYNCGKVVGVTIFILKGSKRCLRSSAMCTQVPLEGDIIHDGITKSWKVVEVSL